jgi:hypothetical protein
LHSGGAENYCGYYGADGRSTRAKVAGATGVGVVTNGPGDKFLGRDNLDTAGVVCARV